MDHFRVKFFSFPLFPFNLTIRKIHKGLIIMVYYLPVLYSFFIRYANLNVAMELCTSPIQNFELLLSEWGTNANRTEGRKNFGKLVNNTFQQYCAVWDTENCKPVSLWYNNSFFFIIITSARFRPI